MLIAIDAHNLEGSRTGVGVYLFRILNEWKKAYESGQLSDLDFLLYFKREIPDDILKMGVFGAKVLKAPFSAQSNALFTQWLVGRAAKKDKVDLLFSPNYTLPSFYKNGKMVVTIHDIIYEARPDLYNWPGILDKIFLRKNVRRSAEKADAILVPSNFTKQEIIKYYKIKTDKITSTPLAVSEEFMCELDKHKITEVKRRYGIYGQYALCVGSIFNRRHIPEIITAFKKIFPQFTDYQLIIIGSNYTRPYIDIEKNILKTNQFLRNILKINDRLPIIHRCFIKQQDLLELYKNAAVSIYLSDYEGFGLPLLESMASGTPVITSKQPALMETAGDAALFVQNNQNIDEIAEKMSAVFSNAVLREKLKQKGLDQVNKFSWSRCATQTLMIFKKLLVK